MTRPWLECCFPHIAYAPSGNVWLHGGNCQKRRGQKVTQAEIQAAKSGHPAGTGTGGGTSQNIGLRWDEGYINAHIDDEDEQAPWEVEV